MGTAGSVPRNPGSKMLVTSDQQYDTIGGGELEFQLIAQARQLLLQGESQQQLVQVPLASKAAQCCGGSVSVLLECFITSAAPVVIFGAGHVAQALMTILQQLPIPVQWLDNRQALVEAAGAPCQWRSDPVNALAELPQHARLIIVTHNHQLDYQLIKTALEYRHFDYIGCIGSATKTERFTLRLQRDGVDSDDIARLTMPIGHPDVQGKEPMAVAVAIAAQLLQQHTPSPAQSNDRQRRQGLHWKRLKQALQTSASDITEPR
ncbi:xanthine dehydrogenase accessory protein XdhC [Bacterioplanes sanyensis]|uniref:Xanthine dehydrogenase accessory protein XdhC n=2 Tax=Bacterioplanes sanyensis TaxID=1249553 RepID=A0A222FPU0_9GAMM|nr:xanthine dehydrogenase accessory protein XdhC [Bacterioplanes sanyensis]